MISGFKQFLLKDNVLSLAVAVIIGGAVGKMVTSMVADIIMPLVSLAMPGGEWRTAKLVLGTMTGPDGKEVVNAMNIGTFTGAVVDFVVIAFVVYVITSKILKQDPNAPK